MILAWQNRIAARGWDIQSRLLPSDTATTVVSAGVPMKNPDVEGRRMPVLEVSAYAIVAGESQRYVTRCWKK